MKMALGLPSEHLMLVIVVSCYDEAAYLEQTLLEIAVLR